MRWQRKQNESEKFEKDVALRMGVGPYLMLAFVLLLPAAGLAFYFWHAKPEAVPALPFLTVFFLAELLAGLLLVARWFQRLTTNSDIEELRKMAYSYRLGGTLGLRPFLNPDGEKLTADSSLTEYRKGIIEPGFYKSATNPPFFLALVLVVSLGLFAFYAPRLGVLELPMIPFLGPELSEWDWTASGEALATPAAAGQTEDAKPAANNRAAFMAYGAGALVCVAFAFAGSLVWAVIYLTRRMALRDVTAYTYQEVTMRLIASAVVALVLYHIFAPLKQPQASQILEQTWAMPWEELLMVLAFGAGVMPETVLRWLGNKASRLFGTREQNDHIDLEHVLGISPFTRARLAEVGIYDAQGLVAANPLRLSMHTPYPLPQIMDWIGQAFLLLQFQPEKMRELRKKGMRTVWELEAARAHLNNQTPLQAESVDGVREAAALLPALKADPNFVRATEIQQRMLLMEKKVV